MRTAQGRIAGYHLRALELIVADLDADTDGRACCPMRSSTSSVKGWLGRGGGCQTAGCMSCSNSRWRLT